MTIDAMIAVLQAAKAGKKIQYSLDGSNEWRDLNDSPNWNFHNYDYRIKPEPLEMWVVRWKTPSRAHCAFEPKEQAMKYAHSPSVERIIHMREVEE